MIAMVLRSLRVCAARSAATARADSVSRAVGIFQRNDSWGSGMKEQQETNYCRHYNGRGFADGTYCRAGVPDSMFGAAAGAGLRRPCVDPNPFAHVRDKAGIAIIPCDKRSMYTPEERAQRKTALEAAMLRTLAGLRIANEWRVKGVPATSRHEAVECPECKGKLHLSQSSLNGHVHGACETAGCMSWME